MNRSSLCSFLSLVFLLCLGLMARGQTPITINGTNPVCKGSSYVYDVTPNPTVTTNYVWLVNMYGAPTITTTNTVTVLWGIDGPGQVEVWGIDTLGDTIEYGLLPVTVLPLPVPGITTEFRVACQSLIPPVEGDDSPNFEDSGCVKTCAYAKVTYNATGQPGSNFEWTVNGGTPSGGTTGSSFTVDWGAPGQGSITVKETTVDGCVGIRTICVEIIESPLAHFVALPDTPSRHLHICDSTDVIFWDMSYSTSASPIVAWLWDFGDGTFSNAQGSPSMPVTHMYTAPGSYTVTLTVTNSCGCSTSETMQIDVDAHKSVQITCPGVVCENTTSTYSVDQPCSPGSWSVEGGSISGSPPPTSGTVTINWGAPPSGFGYVIYDPAPCGVPCPTPKVAKVPVILTNGNIEGEVQLCPNTEYLYRLPQWPSTKFNWSMSSPTLGNMYASDQPNEIIIKTGTTPGTYSVDCSYFNTLLGCSGNATLTVEVLDVAEIIGEDKACRYTLGGSYSLSGGYVGNWELINPEGTTIATNTGNALVNTQTLDWVGVYTLKVTGTGFCPPDPLYIRVDELPPAPNDIIGPDTICKGVPIEYAGDSPLYGTIFGWSVQGGSVNATSGDKTYVTLNPVSTGPFVIELWRETKEFPYCRSESIFKTVDTPYIDPVITGDDTPCKDEFFSYASSFTDGETYFWTIVPNEMGSVNTGQNTPNVNVLWNHQPGTAYLICKMRKCFNEYIDTIVVDISPAFVGAPTLTGGTACVNAPVTVNASGIPSGATVSYVFPDNPTDYVVNTTASSASHTYRSFIGGDKTLVVTLIVPNPSGCPDAYTTTDSITIESAPLVNLGPSVICLNNSPAAFNLTIAPNTSFGNPNIGSWELFHYVPPGAAVSIAGPTNTPPYSISGITANAGFYYIKAYKGTGGTGCWAYSDTIVAGICDGGGNCGDPGGSTAYCNPYFKTTIGCPVVPGTRPVSIIFQGQWVGALQGFQYYDPTIPGWSSITSSITYNMNIPFGSTTVGVRVLASGDTCELTLPLDVPVMPTADFTWHRTVSCALEATIEFTNTSINGVKAFWDFGDISQNTQYDPVKVYDTPGTYAVYMIVTDATGCTDDITQYVDVVPEDLKGATDAYPNNVCEGTPVTLSYIPNVGTSYPDLYEWKKNGDIFAVGTGSSVNVFESGYYWVYGTNQYGCFVDADAVVVDITKMPPVSIFGDMDACEEQQYILSGYAGSDPNISYQWFDDNGTMTGETNASLKQTKSSAGTYNYWVKVTIPKPGGGSCDKMSDMFTVIVHAPPADPSVSWSVVNCNPYQVQLDVSPSYAGTYNWNFGASGTSVVAPLGGPFQVTYTDNYGCESRTSVYTPKDPHVYLWIFPSGCYSICSTAAYTVLGPIIPFVRWEYWYNTGILYSGSGYVPAVSFSSAGVYNLLLDNGYCEAVSGDMDLTLYGCGEGEGKPGNTANIPSLSVGNAGMTLVPNPANQSTRIDYHFDDNGRAHYIEVFDVTGRKLNSRQVSNAKGSWLLTLEGYTPGMYKVVLREGNHILEQSRLSVVK